MEADLAEAIRVVQDTAIRSMNPHIEPVKVDDGKGGSVDLPVAFLPDGDAKLVVHSLVEVLARGAALAKEQRLARAAGPDSRAGHAVHQSIVSFTAHANRFKDEGSAVWANAAQRQLVSVLDYHPQGAASAARWGRHRGTYACPLSEAWQAWGGGRELKLDQDAFAALLDSRDRELAAGKLPNGRESPDPATLITLAGKLEVFSNATAKRERDPNTGRLKISFAEEKGVSGDIVPPPSFLVFIPIFQDADPELLEVRLRVTVEEGAACFAVQIHSAGDVLREAFELLCSHVAVATDLPVFVGTPE